MSNHLRTFAIDDFRQFSSIEEKKRDDGTVKQEHESGASFSELSRFNLFVGENNSGKSSVLEAIRYFCSPMDPLALLRLSRYRQITTRDIDAITALRWLFPKKPYTSDDDFLKTKLSVEANFAGEDTLRIAWVEYEQFLTDVVGVHSAGEADQTTTTPPPEADLRRRGVKLTLNYGDVESGVETEFGTSAYSIVDGESLEVRSPVDAARIPVSFVTSVSHRVEEAQTKKLSAATIDYLKSDAVKLLQLIEPDIKDVDILDVGGRSVIYVEMLGMGFMPLSAFGDGLRRVLTYAISLALAQGGILLIDEIETAIHKDAFVKVYKWLVRAAKKSDVQVFATTHSIEAIDAILPSKKEQMESIVVFQLPDRGEGEIKRFSGDLLHRLRFERGLDLR